MNESTKFYTTLFLTILLTIVSFLGGIITYKIYTNKVSPSILITNGQFSNQDILRLKYQNENINEITLNLMNFQKTNIVYVTNYVDITNFIVINSNITENSSGFNKISDGLTIKPMETVVSTEINVPTNNTTDSDLDKISNQLKQLIEHIEHRK